MAGTGIRHHYDQVGRTFCACSYFLISILNNKAEQTAPKSRDKWSHTTSTTKQIGKYQEDREIQQQHDWNASEVVRVEHGALRAAEAGGVVCEARRAAVGHQPPQGSHHCSGSCRSPADTGASQGWDEYW